MINAWFPTLVYSADLNNLVDNISLKNHAYLLKEKFKKIKSDWRCDTFNTLNQDQFINHTSDQKLTDLVEQCKNHVKEFSKEYGLNNNVVCTEYWFNIAMRGNYQEYHQHANSHFSAVYYVQAEENSGNIVFKSPESITDMFPLPTLDTCSLVNSKTCFYKPAESKLLIFRSNLLHMVEKNQSDTDRISIAMNFRIV